MGAEAAIDLEEDTDGRGVLCRLHAYPCTMAGYFILNHAANIPAQIWKEKVAKTINVLPPYDPPNAMRGLEIDLYMEFCGP